MKYESETVEYRDFLNFVHTTGYEIQRSSCKKGKEYTSNSF